MTQQREEIEIRLSKRDIALILMNEELNAYEDESLRILIKMEN